MKDVVVSCCKGSCHVVLLCIKSEDSPSNSVLYSQVLYKPGWDLRPGSKVPIETTYKVIVKLDVS